MRSHEPWFLNLYRRSILKQQKLRAIRRFLLPDSASRCLDLGGDNGIVSFLLRQGPGHWVSADMDRTAVWTSREILGSGVVQIDGIRLPFRDRTFDHIVVIDLMEHVHEDQALARDLDRVLRDGGNLLLHVPRNGKGLIRWMEPRLGLTSESHGHVREGYDIPGLSHLFPGYKMLHALSYSKAFTQSINLAINTLLSLKKKGHSSKGTLVTAGDLSSSGIAYRIYDLMYPFLWVLSKMDFLLFMSPGHYLLLHLQKEGRHDSSLALGEERS